MRFLSIEPLLEDLGDFEISGLDWAIVGGDSGPGCATDGKKKVGGPRTRALLQKKSVAFFFKQWGGVRKSTAGRLLHGRTYDEMPPIIAGVIPARKNRQNAAVAWQNRAKYWSSRPTPILCPQSGWHVTCKEGQDEQPACAGRRPIRLRSSALSPNRADAGRVEARNLFAKLPRRNCDLKIAQC
jgi:hypothetical protein